MDELLVGRHERNEDAAEGDAIIFDEVIGADTRAALEGDNLVILGDAGEALGDSLYEAKLFVRGSVASLGADCEEKPMTPEQKSELTELLRRAGASADANHFRLYGSARSLYHFHVDNAGAY